MARKNRPADARQGGRQPHKLRIIAGRWRGRRLPVPDAPGLRPTPDRTRETLFNWLGPRLPGANCLDLFAGSGALGLEALSRGARAVIQVERDSAVARHLQVIAADLQADGLNIVQRDALMFLKAQPQPFDVVFLDPPFRQGLLSRCIERLDQGWLSPDADIYLEAERELGTPELPAGWHLRRSGQAGQVGFFLARKAVKPC